MLLQAANATVTMCHTHTRDLAAKCADADVVVVAAGHAGTFGARCAHAGQVVVDVGINWDEGAQRLVGDVDFDAVEPIVGAITPVPGGHDGLPRKARGGGRGKDGWIDGATDELV